MATSNQRGLTKLANGRWRVRVEKGKKVTQRTFETKAKAVAFQKEAKSGKRFVPGGEDITLSDAIDYYKKHELPKKKSPREFNFIQLHEFMFELGIHYLGQVDLVAVQELQTFFSKEMGLANGTVNRRFNDFRAFFQRCIEYGWIDRHPCTGLKNLITEVPDRKLWTQDQQQKLIGSMKGWLKEMTFFFALTGMRPSSISRLKWVNVDWEDSAVSYMSYKGSGEPLKGVHFMLPDLREFLYEKFQTDQELGYGRSQDFVFFKNDATVPVPADQFSHNANTAIRKILKTDPSFLGLDFYAFRHTLVTRITDTHGIYVASKVIGHRSVRTTEKFYVKTKDKSIHAAFQASMSGHVISYSRPETGADSGERGQKKLKLVGGVQK